MDESLTITPRARERLDALIEKASRDGWMTPTADGADDPDCQAEYGEWIQREQEGWEETTHFQILYGLPLSDIADDCIIELGRDLADRETAGWFTLWYDLKEEFWDAWAESHEAAEFWRENIYKED